MEAEQIRELLAVSPSKLEEVAKKAELPLPVAQKVRVQALNLILGKCVLCQKSTPLGLCRPCRLGVQDKALETPLVPQTRERLLRNLEPAAALINRKCSTCDNEFTTTVDTVIRNLFNFGRPHLSKNCPKCKGKIKRMQALNRRKERKRKADNKPKSKPQQHKTVDAGGLTRKPFAKSQVLAEMRPTLKKKGRPQKQAEKVKL